MSEFRRADAPASTHQRNATQVERFERDVRRLQLTRRLLQHNARTQTISTLTGLSRHKISTWRRQWGCCEDARQRGPSPNSFSAFFRSPRLRIEGGCLAALLIAFQAIPPSNTSQNDRWTLDTAQRLCDAFDFYLELLPRSAFTFEKLLLLAKGLSNPACIKCCRCKRCHALMITDPAGSTAHPHCDHCRTDRPDRVSVNRNAENYAFATQPPVELERRD